jgi:bacterioferritin-associated ferredoxin
MAQWRRSRSGCLPVYVCICNGVTESDIRAAAAAGCTSVSELTMRTGCGACCGTCLDMARDLLEASRPSADAPHGNVIPLPVARAA